jgi:hypothetical protein
MGVGGGQQRAVEGVGPGVVHAAQGTAQFTGVLGAQGGPAMTAQVGKGADHSRPVPHEDRVLSGEVDAGEAARGQLVGAQHGEPRAAENVLAVLHELVGVEVVPPGQALGELAVAGGARRVGGGHVGGRRDSFDGDGHRIPPALAAFQCHCAQRSR